MIKNSSLTIAGIGTAGNTSCGERGISRVIVSALTKEGTTNNPQNTYQSPLYFWLEFSLGKYRNIDA